MRDKVDLGDGREKNVETKETSSFFLFFYIGSGHRNIFGVVGCID